MKKISLLLLSAFFAINASAQGVIVEKLKNLEGHGIVQFNCVAIGKYAIGDNKGQEASHELTLFARNKNEALKEALNQLQVWRPQGLNGPVITSKLQYVSIVLDDVVCTKSE